MHGRLPADIQEQIRACLDRFSPIQFAVLYGSAATGPRFQDVDVGIMVDAAAVPPARQLTFGFDVAAALEKVTPVPVDVRILNDAPLPFLYNVSQGQPLLLRDAEAWYRFRERTWSLYLDFQPVAMRTLQAFGHEKTSWQWNQPLGQLAQAQRRLQILGSVPFNEFLADGRRADSAKYQFVVLAGAAIDICNHIVSRSGGRAPQTFADCFQVLADVGVIDQELAVRLQQMARFRNLLVHVYGLVDDRRVYETIHTGLPDLDAFRSRVATWLEA